MSKKNTEKVEKQQPTSEQIIENFKNLIIENKTLTTDFENIINILNDQKKEIENLKNDRLVALADKENHKHMVNEEIRNIRKYEGQKLAEEIVTILTPFEGALKVKNLPDGAKNFLIGFEMIFNNIVQALQNQGVTIIDPKEQETFNPDLQEAVNVEESENKESTKEPIITKVLSKGYMLKDRVIKHALVNIKK
ncbi:nucleotide exchange factor GrpE [Spiroplasma endosymbiont of Anurida maritima]|uniref:nucleotide exchange factor GrpE n=1 Tax=Spiroplasma endosymbiont of Anurida maritima TaxID=2967972 RepID=UPI0036D345BF